MMDTSEILQSKENIQPLRQGRVTSMLCTGLQAQTDGDAERRLLLQRQEFETLLRDDSVDDPMAIWHDYVNWIEQCFPSHSVKAKLNVVLRKCINKYKNNDDYKNDERFVKICLKYATLNEGTLDTFQRLYSNKIGTRHAFFYIAWAEMYAISESYKQANLVYEKGINTLAEPVEMLKEAHTFFQAFLVRKMLNKAEMFEPTSEVLGPTRQVGSKLSTKSNQVPQVRVGENVVAAPGRFPASQKIPSKNTELQVYEGDDDAACGKFTDKMNKVKSHAATTKENHEKAGHWNKNNKNAVFSVPSVPSSFPVHVDEGESESQPREKINVLSSALKPKQIEDEINVDFGNAPLLHEENDPTQVERFCKDQIYAGGMEFQYEELRAIRYRRRMAEAKLAKVASSPPKINSEVKGVTSETRKSNYKIRTSDEARSSRRKLTLDGAESDRRRLGSSRKSNFAGVVPYPSSIGESTVAVENKKMDVPSESFINQTIHTKEAVNEMQELWFAKPNASNQDDGPTASHSSGFNVFVDESCLGQTVPEKQKINVPSSRRTLFAIPTVPVETPRSAATTVVDQSGRKKDKDDFPGQDPLDKAPHGFFNVDFSKMPIFITEPYDRTKRPMYCKEQIYAGGTEFQLEEIMARRHLQRKAERERIKKAAAVSVTSDSVPSAVSNTTGSKSLASDLKEKRSHSARKSNFAGVVRRQLNLEEVDSTTKPGVPTESFVNQTIHTKEAVNEMEKLWFAKPESPPPKQPATTGFEIFVDQSCLEHSGKQPSPVPLRRKLALIPLEPEENEVALTKRNDLVKDDDYNKENSAPKDYVGPFGKSTRPVTGILTPSDNVPFAPRADSDEEEDSDDGYEVPANMTAVTENLTQAFQRITSASTPNTRHSMPRHQVNNESLYDTPNRADNEQPLDLKTVSTRQPVILEEEELVLKQDEPEATEKHDRRSFPYGQRTLPEPKNLSIIVETSREYKSSSSGSGASTLSKFCPVTPGESRFDGFSNSKRFISYSQNEKTPFASKTQSTYGYEASGEMSSAMGPCEVERLQAVPEQDESSRGQSVQDDVKKVNDEMEKLNFNTEKNEEVLDPFCVKLLDSFLEQVNFPTKHHVDGCLFLYSKLQPIRVNSSITVADKTFDFKKLLGEGAYAKVYRVVNSGSGQVQVVKYQKPPFPWEFYIAREIRERCSVPQRLFFMHIEEAYFYENASLFLSKSVEYGDLLTAINLYKVKQGKTMSDFLALYFTTQIFEIINTLHSLQIIHGDIKPDNFLLKKYNGKLQLELIDFGRSIDMKLFPSGTKFTRVVTTEGFTCIEMQTNRPWTYQIDLYGIAACMHCLLFGDYMKVQQVNGIWGITKAIPRYIAKSGWKELFETLLNVPSCDELPNLSDLHSSVSKTLQAYGQHTDLIKLSNFLENH